MTSNTPRQRMTPKRRQHIFTENSTAHNVAPCCICGKPVHRTADRWIVEHKRALALLGPDNNPNCAPAHFDCAQVKTHAEDLPRIRKAKRQQARNEGAKKPSRGFMRSDGYSYDWHKGCYVRETSTSPQPPSRNPLHSASEACVKLRSSRLNSTL